MREKDAFSSLHPGVTFLYFALVFLFAMCLMHPACLGITLLCAAAYRTYLGGGKGLWYLAPVALLAAAVNVAFLHQGATILTYLPDGNPLTLESIFYGAASSVLLAAVILWFSCYSAVMTSDKFVYLFGRVIPAMSLVLSMTLRFVPRFRTQLTAVRDARRCLNGQERGLLRRVRSAVTDTSATVTWAMEHAIETSDSMRSRGYGLPGRTAFSIYRFDGRDRAALLWILVCAAAVASLWIAGGLAWHYYPTAGGAPVSPLTVLILILYGALGLTPLAMDLWSDGKFRKKEQV